MYSLKLNLSKEKITSFFLAIIICANPLTWLLKISNGLALIVLFSSIIITLLNFNTLGSRINIYNVLLILLIYLHFVISLLSHNFNIQTLNYLIQFSILGLFPILFSSLKIELYQLLNYTALIGLLFIPFVFNFKLDVIAEQNLDNPWGAIMGYSYGLLRFLIASIFLFLFLKKHYLNKTLLIIEIIIILIFELLFGSRGAILSIILSILSMYIINNKNTSISILKTTFIVCILSLLLYLFINTLYPYLNEFGINFEFLNKLFRLKEAEDISNGRSEFINLALKEFIEKPFLGNGIGSFDNFSGGYPHNLFIHLLYEGGITLFLPFIIILAKAIIIILSKNYTDNTRWFVAFLFLSSTVELLFSSYPWISQIFWLLIGVTITAKKKIQTQSTIKKDDLKIQFNANSLYPQS